MTEQRRGPVRGIWHRYLRPLGWLGILSAVLVAAAAILAATKDYLPSSVLIVLLVVVATQGAKVVDWVKRQRIEAQEEASLLRIRRPISKVDPYKEGLVFRSALAERDYPDRVPAYIPRGNRGDIDAKLDEALQMEQFVLVTGASKSGKTRTAFEAVRRMQPEPTLLVPASSRALPKVLSRALFVNHSGSSVLWLDDLDRYLEDPELSRALFNDLREHESRVVILATITLTAYGRLRTAEDEIGRLAREILSFFETEFTLPSELSPSEREEAQHLYPSQRFTAGIGEHFAAARELIDRFKAAIEAHRHGFAVVVAALDWRRSGLSRPITYAELRELYILCLERFYPLLKASDADYQAGIAWACEPLESRAALLMRAAEEGVEGFRIFDFVRDWCDGASGDVDQRLRAVPELTWRFVISKAVGEEVLAVGTAAHVRGEVEAAAEAWTKVVRDGRSEWTPLAAYNLGYVLSERGDYTSAERFYQQAIDSGHPEWAPMAADNLGILYSKRGDYANAERFYQQAIDSGHPEATPMAAFNLGVLFSERELYAEAEQAYQRAIDSGHPEVAPLAARALQQLWPSDPG